MDKILLVCHPRKYIDRLIESYHSMFKQDPPKDMRTPLDKNDHPELDDTELLTGESNQHYLTMIGQLQWLVTLGRFDIHTQVTTMSRFRSAPRKGYLERLQRIYGCPEDQTLFNQVQNRGTRLQLPS